VEKLKWKIINTGLAMIPVDEKIVRMILDVHPNTIQPTVIIVVTKMIYTKLINSIDKPDKKSVHVTNGKIGTTPVSIIRTHIGGPHTAMVVEALKRCNIKRIIRFDICGSISDEIPLGSLIAVKSSLLLDGTCKDYLEAYASSLVSSKLISKTNDDYVCGCDESMLANIESLKSSIQSDLIKPVICEKSVSTDSLFLETETKIREWNGKGALAVDMENSVVYLLSALFNIQTIGLLVVSDKPSSNEYDLLNSNKVFEDLEFSIAKSIKFLKKFIETIK
jgi:uridine phosphorylase